MYVFLVRCVGLDVFTPYLLSVFCVARMIKPFVCFLNVVHRRAQTQAWLSMDTTWYQYLATWSETDSHTCGVVTGQTTRSCVAIDSCQRDRRSTPQITLRRNTVSISTVFWKIPFWKTALTLTILMIPMNRFVMLNQELQEPFSAYFLWSFFLALKVWPTVIPILWRLMATTTRSTATANSGCCGLTSPSTIHLTYKCAWRNRNRNHVRCVELHSFHSNFEKYERLIFSFSIRLCTCSLEERSHSLCLSRWWSTWK